MMHGLDLPPTCMMHVHGLDLLPTCMIHVYGLDLPPTCMIQVHGLDISPSCVMHMHGLDLPPSCMMHVHGLDLPLSCMMHGLDLPPSCMMHGLDLLECGMDLLVSALHGTPFLHMAKNYPSLDTSMSQASTFCCRSNAGLHSRNVVYKMLQRSQRHHCEAECVVTVTQVHH